MITVIIMGDNAGFGAANNVAVERAMSDRIFLINPDVYPIPAHAALLSDTVSTAELGSTLWGGLLFYDEYNLMHSGIYIERDSFVRRNALNRVQDTGAACSQGALLRTEHFDKGVPFEARHWGQPKEVPAVTGAVMAFARAEFEKLQGFSTNYIYGHYEDADLSFRWRRNIGPVMVHPALRLVHLEGQGSRPRARNFAERQ